MRPNWRDWWEPAAAQRTTKFYAVESSFEKKFAERFRLSPQAAITYLGILVSACKVLAEVRDCRVMVVDDHEFGTTIARDGSRSREQQDLSLTEQEEAALVEQAKRWIRGKRIGAHRFYQFRPAFDKAQAKGAFKVMADEVARHLDADIILPRSCVKPKYQGKVLVTIQSLMKDRQARHS